MRKFTSILSLLLFGLGAMAQTGIPLTKGGHLKPATDYNRVRQTVKTAQNHQRATTPFAITVDFDGSDEGVTVDSMGGTYNRYAWRLNHNFPNDSLHDYDLRFSAVTYDTLIDVTNNHGYSLQNNPVTVDSVDVIYQYARRAAGTNKDTVIIRIYSVGTNGLTVGTDSLPSSVNTANQTILHADTVLINTNTPSGQNGVITVYPNFHVPLNQHFAIGVDFYGDTLNDFSVLGGGGDNCGNNCGSKTSIAPANADYRAILWQAGRAFTFSTPISYIFFDCNGNSRYDADSCEFFYITNFAYFANLTIAPPLSADVTSDKVTACPNGIVSLKGNINGGTPPYTITWTGTGVNNPTDENTTAVVGGAISDSFTYVITVVDGGGTTVTDSIKIRVKGIGVSAGNDTTIGCGTTITLHAATSGNIQGIQTQWTGALSGATLNLPGAGPGKYVVVVTNNSGCTAKDSIVVSLPILQTLNFSLHTQYGGNGHIDTVTFSPCTGVAANFINTSTTTANWTWSWTVNPGGGIGTQQDYSTIFPSAGVDTVTLQGDSAGCTLTKTKIVSVLASSNINCRDIIGINNIDFANLVSVYPNPTTGVFNINFSEINSANVNLSVYDLVGKNVYTSGNFNVNGNETKSIDLSKNANGIYFVRVQVDGQPYTVKLTLNK